MRIVFVFAGLLEFKGRLLKQIATLQDDGHECILIHGQKEQRPPDYSSYDFEVHPYKLVCHPNKAINYLRHIRFNVQAARKALSLKPDALVCVELTSAFSGVLVRGMKRSVMFVFDCNELFMEKGMNRLKKAAWKPIHSLAFRKADTILHAEKNRLKFCMKNYTSNANHVLLENLPRISTGAFAQKRLSSNVRVVYLGALIPSRHCEDIILAFSNMQLRDVTCDLIGFGEEEYIASLHSLISDNGITNVRIQPPVSNASMLDSLANYDIGLAFYRNTNLNQYYCAPNKIYDYIVMGLAVVTNRYPGLIDVVEKDKIGVCIDEVTPETIRDALQTIIQFNLKGNISYDVQIRYIWKNQENAYLAIYSQD